MNEQTLSPEFWDELYRTGQTAWDLGQVSTPIKAYVDQLTDKNLRILIPGAGKSYEAIYLATQGFTNITVADISPVLTQSLREAIGNTYPSIRIITGDFFTLEGSFDLILEQTFFCALHPSLRKKYVATVTKLLTGNGKLAGVLFNREFETHPPYGGSTEAYRQLFSASLRIQFLDDCYNSIAPRAGTEVFIVAGKR